MVNYQKGHLYKKNGAYHVRYWEPLAQPKQRANGTQQTHRRRSRRLAAIDEVGKKEAIKLKDQFMTTMNKMLLKPTASVTFSDFVEKTYFPWAERKLKPSTVNGYRKIYEKHLKDRIGPTELRNISKGSLKRMFDDIELDNPKLSGRSLVHIRNFLSGVFSYAEDRDHLEANPIRRLKVAEPGKPKTHAYSLDEIRRMLVLLPEPFHTMIGVAAFSGLSLSEIRGLQWDDYDGEFLHVHRAVWRSAIGEPKTEARKQSVPMIKPLREMLDRYKAMTPGVGWIFTNAKGRPAWLDNLALREIRPVIEAAGIRWHGWHAFRRGLATNLYHMGISEAIVQRILRHEKGSVVTRKHYIQTDTPQAVVAMKQFEEQWEAIGRQLDDKQVN